MTRSANCGDRKRRSRLARSSSATCVGDPRLEFGVPLGQLGGLPPDGVVVALDARQRRHPGQQLALVERLGDEVVGTGHCSAFSRCSLPLAVIITTGRNSVDGFDRILRQTS